MGEKKSEDVLAAPGAVVGRPPFLPPLCPRAEREIVESRSEYLYNGAAGVRNRAFVSDMFWTIAARLTERCNDQAIRPRQRRTDMARKPNMAPTAINTDPSGRFEVCMYGALAVGGTEGATIL